MKALSIKEPWASLIWKGEKTIETRVWSTRYRGPLILCASKYPTSHLSGMAFAIADLVECRPMTASDEAKAQCRVYPKAQAWVLRNKRNIELFPVRGTLGLFDVEYTPSRRPD